MKKLTENEQKLRYEDATRQIIGTHENDVNEIAKVMLGINAANRKGLKMIRTQLKIYVRYIDLLLKK